MSSPSPDTLAQRGASQTGLPLQFVRALIQLEGTYPASGNPFDVTQTWANLTGHGSFVTGLWNSIGVAIFSDPNAAVDSWAKGINTFSNYAKLRADLAAGSSMQVLAQDLSDAGYGGGSEFAGLLMGVIGSGSGGSSGGGGSGGAGGGGGGGTGGSTGGGTSGAGWGTSWQDLVPKLPDVTLPDLGGVIQAASNIATALAQLPANAAKPFVDAITYASALGGWLGQKNLIARVSLFLVGAVVLLVGIVLLGMSLVSKQEATTIAKAAMV